MTLVQEQSRPTDHPTVLTVSDAMDASGPHVWDDMTVEVALSVMTSARAGHVLVSDVDGRCTGLITRAQLALVREASGYTDRVRLREIVGLGGVFTSPVIAAVEAERTMRRQRLRAMPVVDEDGCAVGVFALSC